MSTENKLTDREIVNTRIINASKEQIFKAFVDPNQLKNWWGPKGFKNTFYSFDLRPGGIWHYVMHAPNGADYENKSSFVEVVEPEKIVLRHLEPDHEFLLTVTLNDVNGKTEINWSMLFESAEECNKVRNFVIEGNEQNLDRLESHLLQ